MSTVHDTTANDRRMFAALLGALRAHRDAAASPADRAVDAVELDAIRRYLALAAQPARCPLTKAYMGIDLRTLDLADAEAGKDGAADRLAELYRTLVSTSKEAFGTAGTEYSADRAAATVGIERVVQIENDRIAAASAAQKATTDAVAAGNALLNEGNGLTVTTHDKLDAIYAALTRSGGSPTLDLASITR